MLPIPCWGAFSCYQMRPSHYHVRPFPALGTLWHYVAFAGPCARIRKEDVMSSAPASGRDRTVFLFEGPRSLRVLPAVVPGSCFFPQDPHSPLFFLSHSLTSD